MRFCARLSFWPPLSAPDATGSAVRSANKYCLHGPAQKRPKPLLHGKSGGRRANPLVMPLSESRLCRPVPVRRLDLHAGGDAVQNVYDYEPKRTNLRPLTRCV